MRGHRAWLAAIAAAALGLCLAQPPGTPTGAGWLVLPGLAMWYALASGERRPYLATFGIGVAYFAWVAWSIRYVTGDVVYTALAVAGGCHSLLVAGWTRAGMRWGGGAAMFAIGVAVESWLRTVQPEIPYPHAQPAHALYHWPALLGPVRWGGETLMNLLCAAVAAAVVDLGRAWRVARPSMRRAAVGLAVPVTLWALGCLVAPAAAEVEPVVIDVVLIEPGAADGMFLGARTDATAREATLIRPTVAVAGIDAPGPPDLVVWPESSLPSRLIGDPPRLSPRLATGWLAPATRLVAGTVRELPDGGRMGATVLLDPQRGLVGWHEKQVPVPGGERVPFLGLMPEGLAEWFVEAATGLVNALPDLRAGGSRPPLETTAGVPFGVLLCFDNAFPQVAREMVADGARLLVVASNEAWYLGGAELDHMVAMSVFRALENATPVVRSTADGHTCAIDAAGRTIAFLDHDPSAVGRSLRVQVTAGSGRPTPASRLAPWIDWGCASTVVLVLAYLLSGALSRAKNGRRLADRSGMRS